MKSKQNIPDVISDSIEMRKGYSSSAKNSRRFSAPRRTNTQPVTFRQEHGSGVASAAIRPFTMPLLPYMYKPKETVVKIDEEGGSNQTTVVVKPIDPDKIKEISEKLADEKFEGYEEDYFLAQSTIIIILLMILIMIFLFVKFWPVWSPSLVYDGRN